MFWNKKEEKKGALPELPPLDFNMKKPEIQSLKTLPSLPEETEEKTKLPAFPESPAHDKFSQVVIKEAIRGPEPKPMIREETESQEWTPTFPEERQKEPRMQFQRIPRQEVRIEAPPREEKKDIFVKIDKFRAAKKSMELISKNLIEMEDLIRKIRDTKMREEQEFTNWERDINSIKERIANVREDIFERL